MTPDQLAALAERLRAAGVLSFKGQASTVIDGPAFDVEMTLAPLPPSIAPGVTPEKAKEDANPIKSARDRVFDAAFPER